MNQDYTTAQQNPPAHKFLWAVKTYLDLINRSETLVYGSGLKRLYAMSSGVPTLNDDDVKKVTQKAETQGMMNGSLSGFLTQCILNNLSLYGQELRRLIHARIMGISNGDVQNPESRFRFSPVEARRAYYVPPSSFVKRINDALNEDYATYQHSFSPAITTKLIDVMCDGDFILNRMQITEGHLAESESSWGALATCVDGLVDVLTRCTGAPDIDYKERPYSALKLLWIIAKLLSADLTSQPAVQDTNMVDMDQKIDMTDGTLAALPFPTAQTVKAFTDEDRLGLSLKGRMYLSAVSAAVFYRGDTNA